MGLAQENIRTSHNETAIFTAHTVKNALIRQLVEEFPEYDIHKEPQYQHAAESLGLEDYTYDSFVDKAEDEQRPVIFVRQFNVNQYERGNEAIDRTYQNEVRFFLGNSTIPNHLKDDFIHRGQLCSRYIYIPTVSENPEGDYITQMLPVRATRQTSTRGNDNLIMYVDYKVRLIPNVIYDKMRQLGLNVYVKLQKDYYDRLLG